MMNAKEYPWDANWKSPCPRGANHLNLTSLIAMVFQCLIYSTHKHACHSCCHKGFSQYQTDIPQPFDILITFSYTLQVRISVETSRCHSDNLHLELISNKPHQSTVAESRTSGRVQCELIEEVVRREEASLHAEEEKMRRPKLNKEEREFRQSKGPNLYSILQEISELALFDTAFCHMQSTEVPACTTSA